MNTHTYRIPRPSRELFQEVVETFPTDPLLTELTFVSRFSPLGQSVGSVQLVYDFNRYIKRFIPKKVRIEDVSERRNVSINEIFLSANYDPALMKMLRTEFLSQMAQQNYVLKHGSFLLYCTMDKSFISGVKFGEQGLEAALRIDDNEEVVVYERRIKYWFDRLAEKYLEDKQEENPEQ
jgi:hypothetical protein